MFTVFLVVAGIGELRAQKPEDPVVQYVSVDPETGYTIIAWLPGPTPELIDYYLIEQVDGAIGNVISEVINPARNSYVITTRDDPHFRSVGYAVVAVNDLGMGYEIRSGWKANSTIFLQAEFDSCLSVVSLNWNPYYTWSGSIKEYRIYQRLGAGIYVPMATVDGNLSSFNLPITQPNHTYQLFVEAFHTDGIRSSKSNMIHVDTDIEAMPEFINADYATIGNGNGIDLSFTLGNSPGPTFYRLLRSEHFDGPYTAIDSFNLHENQLTYSDNVNFTEGIYYYRLDAVNNCGIGALQSNRANNIILNGSFSDMTARLEWNEYRDWEGNVDEYKIVRTIGGKNPVTDTIASTGTTSFNDPVHDLVNYLDPAEGLVCYSVVAKEIPNRYGISGKSESNSVCFSIKPTISMPNAIIPNGDNLENQRLEPVFSFTPEHYELIIYNRLGSKIWEGKGPWDGRVNGKYVTEGVYVYYMRVFDYSGGIREFNGKVTVIYR